MRDDVDGVGQSHDRVADERPRAVPGDLAAAIDIHDPSAIKGALKWFGATAGGVDRLVLEEEDGVGEFARNDLRVDRALELPAGEVLNCVAAEADLAHLDPKTPKPLLIEILCFKFI